MFYNIQHITNILMVLLMVAIVDDVTLWLSVGLFVWHWNIIMIPKIIPVNITPAVSCYVYMTLWGKHAMAVLDPHWHTVFFINNISYFVVYSSAVCQFMSIHGLASVAFRS